MESAASIKTLEGYRSPEGLVRDLGSHSEWTGEPLPGLSRGVTCSNLGFWVWRGFFLVLLLLFKHFHLSNIPECHMFATLLEIEHLCYFINMFVTNV